VPVLPRLVLLALAVLAVVHAAGPMFTNDAFWHVNTGRHILQHGFGGPDPFSFTAVAQPWFQHEWLTQVVFALVHDGLFGMYGLRALTALSALVLVLLVHRLAHRLLPAPAAGAGVALFLLLGAVRLQTRPELFTIGCALGLLLLFTRPWPWTWRRTGAVFGLALSWVNCHSVGLLAVPLTAAFLAGAACVRRATPALVATLPATGLASCLTPAGPALWGFAFQDKDLLMRFVPDEWAPLRLRFADNEALGLAAYVTILVSLALLLFVYLRVGLELSRDQQRPRRWLPDPTLAALCVLTLVIALSARRFHWLLAASVLLALALAPRPAPLLRLAALVPWIALPVLALGDLRPRSPSPTAFAAPVLPFFDLPGLRFLRATGAEGNLFCAYGAGGIASYELYPSVRVFADSRIDLYGRAIHLDYLAIRNARPDQGELLSRYGADLYYRHWDVAPLRDRAGWVEIYRGPDGEIFRRAAPAPR
jgi:hypothetical protein